MNQFLRNERHAVLWNLLSRMNPQGGILTLDVIYLNQLEVVKPRKILISYVLHLHTEWASKFRTLEFSLFFSIFRQVSN